MRHSYAVKDFFQLFVKSQYQLGCFLYELRLLVCQPVEKIKKVFCLDKIPVISVFWMQWDVKFSRYGKCLFCADVCFYWVPEDIFQEIYSHFQMQRQFFEVQYTKSIYGRFFNFQGPPLLTIACRN